MTLESRIKKLEETVNKEEKMSPIVFILFTAEIPAHPDVIFTKNHNDWLTVKTQITGHKMRGAPQVVIVDPAEEVEARRKINGAQ